MPNNSSEILLAMDTMKFLCKESFVFFLLKCEISFPLISKFKLAFAFIHIVYFYANYGYKTNVNMS